ncbi:hypothetical protein KKE60_07235 [Patescibacteria group bacterium]|nr:hypothetical protein [Patescibacteria group bacterium]
MKEEKEEASNGYWRLRKPLAPVKEDGEGCEHFKKRMDHYDEQMKIPSLNDLDDDKVREIEKEQKARLMRKMGKFRKCKCRLKFHYSPPVTIMIVVNHRGNIFGGSPLSIARCHPGNGDFSADVYDKLRGRVAAMTLALRKL